MSYRVREWIERRYVQKRQIESDPPRADGAFAHVARSLRAQYPELFWRADLIRMARDKPYHQRDLSGHLTAEKYERWRCECEWCGDTFFDANKGARRFCRRDCQHEHRRWMKRRLG